MTDVVIRLRLEGADASAQGVGKVNQALQGTASASLRLGGAMSSMVTTGVVGFLGSQVAQAALAAGTALYQASAQAQNLRTLLDFATAGQGAKALADVSAIADQLGLSVAEAAKSYGQLQAAARGTSLAGEGAKQVFAAVSQASAVMGLSAADTSGVLQALQQMISKGTVQAEELRGQLGERLPGAFQIAARAMGVTTAELSKMLEQGQVVASDFLPKFAAKLRDELGGAAEEAANRLDASAARMVNAWEKLKQALGDSGFASGASEALKTLTDDMNAISEAMKTASLNGSGFFMQLVAGAGVAAGRLLNLQTVMRGLNPLKDQAKFLGEQLQGLEAQQLALSKQGVRSPQVDAAIERTRASLNEVTKLQQKLAGDDGSGVTAGRFVRAGAEKTAAEERLESARTALTAATEKASGANTEYVKALQAVANAAAIDPEYTADKQAADLTALAQKYGKDAVDRAKAGATALAAQTAASAELQLQIDRNASQQRLRAMDAELTALDDKRASDVISLAEYADQKAAIQARMLAEQLAFNAREVAAKQAERPADAAGRTKQLAELRRLEGEAAKLRDEGKATAAQGLQDYYDQSAKAYGKAADDLRQAGARAQQQILAADDANARDAISLITDPVARATAASALEVSQARQQTEAEIKALQAAIGQFKASGFDLVDPDAVTEAEARIKRLRDALSTREGLIGQNLSEQLKPEWQRTLEGWSNTTRTMRETWDTTVTDMVGGAADAFGKFVSGQKVSLSSLAQGLSYTLGKGLFQSAAGSLGAGLLSKLGSSAASADGGTVKEGAEALTDAASASQTALTTAGSSIVQSALGWLLPQSAQTTAAVTLGTAGSSLVMAAGSLTSAAALLSASAGASAAGDSIGMAAMFAANGAMLNGSGWHGVQAFAAGGAFGSGEVLTAPTLFRYRQNGAVRMGVAGEAGAEAALPLRQGGVAAALDGQAIGSLPLKRVGGVLGVDVSALSDQLLSGRAFATGGAFGDVAVAATPARRQTSNPGNAAADSAQAVKVEMNLTFHGSGVQRAELAEWAKQIKKTTEASVADGLRRGRKG